MARAYIIIGIALMLAASTGCNRYHVEDILLPRNEISLTVKGLAVKLVVPAVASPVFAFHLMIALHYIIYV